MKLVDVYDLSGIDYEEAVSLLYDILKKRPLAHGISHKGMPSWDDHLDFIISRPFRYWYIIEQWNPSARNEFDRIGAIECLPTNEFGIHLLKEFQGKGLGREAVELFLSTHEPLPAIPAVRNGHWLANCSQNNTGAIEFFKALGFHKIQETFEL